MSLNFNADEIFQMAEQMERNGAKFYKDAAEGLSGSPNKEMLLMLADMEVQHEKTFSSLRSELTNSETTTDIYDPQGETALYLKSLVDTRVFFKKEIDVTSIKEILKEAINAEKDSIVFYLGMKEMVPERLGKSKMDHIIQEEMGHIRLLGGELAKLKE